MADEVWDAVDAERLRLLKTDPDRFFTKDRRQPFGFVVTERDRETGVVIGEPISLTRLCRTLGRELGAAP